MDDPVGFEAIYKRRFSPDLTFRRQMWQILCQDFFQRYVPVHSTVLEVGAGYCEFINNIKADHKVAVDINPDTRRFASPDVKTIIASSTDLSMIPARSIDVVFASNFFEHLSRRDIVRTVQEVARVLRTEGRFLILQPNFRFCYRDYWMFFDHITPLDDRSLVEALETNGFKAVQTLPRFLPYTTKGRLPKSLFLLRVYLRLPLIWRIFGQQTFIVAQVSRPEI